MGSGASSEYASVKDALAAGKTKEEIDKYLATHFHTTDVNEAYCARFAKLPTDVPSDQAAASVAYKAIWKLCKELLSERF